MYCYVVSLFDYTSAPTANVKRWCSITYYYLQLNHAKLTHKLQGYMYIVFLDVVHIIVAYIIYKQVGLLVVKKEHECKSSYLVNCPE